MLFLGTRMGLSIRATGDNPDMVRASSLNPSFTITVGLCLANMLTALSGAIVGQYQKTVDINSGTGIVVIGLACLIIGETLLGRRSVKKGVIAAIPRLDRLPLHLRLRIYTKIVPVECLKLLTAIIVALAIAGAEHPEVGDVPRSAKWPPEIRRACKMLDIQNLSKTFNPGTVNEKKALSSLSLHLDEGDFVTIVGSNGAGKSTLFNAIAGSFYADEGSIFARRARTSPSCPSTSAPRRIGRLFQDPLRGTGAEHDDRRNLALAYLRAAHGNPSAASARRTRSSSPSSSSSSAWALRTA